MSKTEFNSYTFLQQFFRQKQVVLQKNMAEV